MVSKIYLSLALHNHQPVGNFGWVFEEAYEKAYLPMIECLERHPKIRLAQHYTGPLRDWLLENRPDFFPRIRKLVERGQIEVLSGAYYEPVLASLPDADKIGQIRKQSQSVRDDFGYEPTGMWLAERIWEPHLPRALNMAGIQYTIVDDTHFKNVGYKDEELLGYYVTEEQGHSLKIFATSMPLRYSLPWSPVENVIDWLRAQVEGEGPMGIYAGRTKVAVMGDDGEKFGLWPGTHQHVWVEGWMDRFFEAIEQNSDWLETIPPGEFAQQHPSLGRIYLPTASYDEMGEWALPPDAAWLLPHLKHALKDEMKDEIVQFMRGGMWRNFMVKYPEVNQLHKKALWVSKKVHNMPEGPDKQSALDHLWAGQCNCGYWHGVFGGIYLFHIRVADYEHLIKAENLADGVDGKPFVQAEVADFDLDGVQDVVISTDRQNLIFSMNLGGALVEWDYRPAAYNLTNVLTRRREGYHKDLLDAAAAGTIVTPDMEETGGLRTIHTTVVRAREKDLDQYLMYDWHRRAIFLDHFLGEEATVEGMYRSDYPEQGDFVNQIYHCEVAEKSKKRVTLHLWRDGHVWQGEAHLPVHIEKRIAVEAGSDKLTATYRLTNRSDSPMHQRFGIETVWGFAGGNETVHASLNIGAQSCGMAEVSEEIGLQEWSIVSPLWKVRIDTRVDLEATVWRFPLEGISASEAGYERNYQGTMIMPWWLVELEPGESWTLNIDFSLSQLDS